MMSESAIRRALAVARKGPADLDAILFTGVLPEQPMPNTATLLHRALGCRSHGVTCLDVNASCAGFFRALEMAAAGIACGLWRTVAIVAAEVASKGLRWEDLDTCTLFGDGAAAVIVEASGPESGILDLASVTLSQGADLCQIKAGGSKFNVRTPPPHFDDYLFAMQGRTLLRLVQEHFPPFLEGFIDRARERAKGDRIDLVIPHQASAVGLAFLRKQLAPHGLPAIDILAEVGNQVTVSTPYALHAAIESGQCRRGQTALLVGTAAGVSINGILLRY
jgi:3-oxoacyl-[acyl-carrier-protein] synthase-3